MAEVHREGDLRACGATTIVSGQGFVYADGHLWAVDGDLNSHGGGNLIPSIVNAIYINGKKVIVVGDQAAPDGLSPDSIDGGLTPHDDPFAVTGDPTITAS